MPENLSDDEIMRIFVGLTGEVRLGGIRSDKEDPEEWKEEIAKKGQKRIKRVYGILGKIIDVAKRPSTRNKAMWLKSHLRTLYRKRFMRRFAEEAEKDPNGFIALTFKYGADTAKEIILERERRKMGSRLKPVKTTRR